MCGQIQFRSRPMAFVPWKQKLGRELRASESCMREFLSIVGDYRAENCAKVSSASSHKKESTLLFTELETSREREDAENIILDTVLIGERRTATVCEQHQANWKKRC